MMKFLTGSGSVPVLGLPSKMRVEFKHGCIIECRCKPSVSTCDLTLNIAVHYRTVGQIEETFMDAISLSSGFDTI